MPTTLAIVQSYAFPYSSYFNPTQACDSSVCCDDVNFIVEGQFNHNQVLINSKPYRFSIPLAARTDYSMGWRRTGSRSSGTNKFLKLVVQGHARAACFDAGYQYASDVMRDNCDLLSCNRLFAANLREHHGR